MTKGAVHSIVIACVLALAGPGAAQAKIAVRTLALGQGLSSIRVVPEGLLVQGESRVSLMDPGPEARVLAEAPLPSGVFAWTRVVGPDGARLEMQSSAGRIRVPFVGPDAERPAPSILPGVSLFRGNATAAPEPRDFVRSSGGIDYVVRPRLEGFDVGIDGESFVLPAAVASEQSLGWGLGYEMSARMIAPFFAFVEGDGRPGADILYRDGSRFMLRALAPDMAKVESVVWGLAPAAESTEVVRFDQRVPPLVRDLDGDGLADMIHLDTGGGYVFVYRGRGRAQGEGREPDQIFNVGGHALWRFLEDVDGDGRLDLLVLTMSRMNVVAQVNVMRERSLPVRLYCRLQREDGDFAPSASWSLGLQLPCEIALTRNVRRVRFRAPLLVLGHREGRARILGTRNGRLALFEREGDDWKELVSAPDLVLDQGHWADPFDAPRGDLDGDGRDEVYLLARDVDGDLDRLLRLSMP